MVGGGLEELITADAFVITAVNKSTPLLPQPRRHPEQPHSCWGGGRWPGNGCLGGTGRAEGTWESPACVCLCVCTCSGINIIHLIAHYQKASFFSPWPCFNDPCRDPSSLNLLPESRQLRQSQWGGSRGDPAPVPCLGLSQAPSFPSSQQPPPSDPETPPWVPGEPDLQMSNMARTIAIY